MCTCVICQALLSAIKKNKGESDTEQECYYVQGGQDRPPCQMTHEQRTVGRDQACKRNKKTCKQGKKALEEG